MALNEKHDFVQWPEMHYLFLEKVGPFMQTAPACWQELHIIMPELLKHYEKKAAAALYKMEPKMVYRAGRSRQKKI